MMMRTIICLILVSSIICVDYSKQKGRPLIIAHRGYASLYPQNTLQAFEAGLYAGADFVELDVQISKDGVLMVSHDPYLSRVTNIESKPQFASRKTNQTYGGKIMNDWWIYDFTVAELKTLGIKQVLVPDRPSLLDFQVTFPTLEEVIQLVIKFNQVHKGKRNPEGRLGGVLIQCQDPAIYREQWGIQQGVMIVNLLDQYGLQTMNQAALQAPMMLHSFDAESVALWHSIAPTLPNSMLASDQASLPQSINQTAQFARCVGLFISSYFNDKYHIKTGLIKEIHKNGLMAHGWTYRDDALTWNVQHIYDQYQQSFVMGIDGIITQFPEAATNVIQMMKNSLQGRLYWGLHERKIQKNNINSQQLGQQEFTKQEEITSQFENQDNRVQIDQQCSAYKYQTYWCAFFNCVFLQATGDCVPRQTTTTP